MKLNKLVSFVYSFNEIAQKNTLHLGFQQEALLREHYFNHREGKFIDLYQNGMLQKDFFVNKSISRWSRRLLGRDITARVLSVQPKAMSKAQLDKGLEVLTNQVRAQRGQVRAQRG